MATIAWQAAPGDFRRGRFSRVHTWEFDGGMTIAASSSPSVIPPPYSDSGAVDPEEAFVAAIASCHMMSFLYVANRAGIDVASYRDAAVGSLGRTAAGRLAITQVTLQPAVEYRPAHAVDAAQERALHDEAHAICFIANSVLSDIVIAPLSAA